MASRRFGPEIRAIVARAAPTAPTARVAPTGLAGLALLGALAGCDAGHGVGADVDLDADGTMRLAVPSVLDVRAVDTANLVPRVLVNNRGVISARVDDQWTARVTVPEGSDVRVSITWFERIARGAGRVDLPLAATDFTVSAIARDETVVRNADDYDSDGFDEDEDGVSNLAERIANTSPFDPDDPGDDFAQVFVPMIDPSDSPIIDGAFDPVWSTAQYRDRDNDELAIDNLMVDDGAVLLDGESGYRWGAMHDGEALYLIVFAEAGTGQTPFGDSAEAFNDDSIDVYFDADDSKLSEYDGVDDRHLIVPLLDANGSANSSASADARIEFGPNTAPFDLGAVTFAACPCPGDSPDDVQIYELRLPLATFDVAVDTTIGFEVHVNDDRDGGDRDVKWGWWHPSRGNMDIDYTFVNPSFMGTVRLLP